MSLAQSSSEIWTETKNKPTWILGYRCFITICIWLSVYMCIYMPMHQWGARVRSETTHALFPARKNTRHRGTHNFGSSPAQQNLPQKLNGVFVFARSGVHSILAPVNLLSSVICAPPSWSTPVQWGGTQSDTPCYSAAGAQRNLRAPSSGLWHINSLIRKL